MSSLVQQRIRNDFSFMGVTEKRFDENPDYMEIYEFEKQDYTPLYFWLNNNLYPLFAIGAVYVVFVFALQKWMKNREAFDLRKPLFVWSSSLAILSMIMFSRMLPELLHINHKYGFYRSYCKRDHFNVATVFWVGVYGASKVLEFIDTAFIILRKNKLTFLHTFHHTSVYIACLYGMVRLDPAARYFAFMNTFVHSVMYSYYALKAAQFKLPRKLAMAVTATQLLQFATAIVINCLVVYHRVMGTEPTCERPDDVSVLFGLLAVVYLYLFGNFFVQSYLKKKPVTKPKLQ